MKTKVAKATAETTDWTLLEDPKVEWAIRSAAEYGANSFNRWDLIDDLVTEAELWVVVRPLIVAKHRAGDAYSYLRRDIYSGAVRPYLLPLAKEAQVTVSLDEDHMEPTVTDGYMIGGSRLMDDSLSPGIDPGPYTIEKVTRLASVCWFGDLFKSLRDPYGEREEDPNEDRASKANPSHKGNDMVEMIDMRRAYCAEPGNWSNRAGLTVRQAQALYLSCVLDFTMALVADLMGVSRRTAARARDEALVKIANFLNNPKGVSVNDV